MNTTILNAVNTLVNTVKVTLGTKGRTVLYNTDENKPHITKDGVSVARHIASDSNYENMVMTVLREASVRTMLNAGDGTTTTLVIAQALIEGGYKLMSEGYSYYEIAKAYDKMRDKIINYITTNALLAEDNTDKLKHVASIAANDESIGEFIYDIISEIGVYGDIQVKNSMRSETYVDKTKGMKLHKGYIEGFMVNNLKEMTFTAKDCFTLLISDEVRSMNDILPYLEYSIKNSRALVVFCDDVSDITLKQLKSFMEAHRVELCFVQNDGFRDKKEILLNDLAAITGSYIIEANDTPDTSVLGIASDIKVEELYTSVSGGNPNVEVVESIIESIKMQLDINDENDDLFLTNVDRKWYKKRLANLTGGVAVIYAGGDTEMEMKELKDRLDDAVLAVQSAVKDGVCLGGGYTLIHCHNSIKSDNKAEQVVLDAMLKPFTQLLINSDNYKNYDAIRNSILSNKGLDLRTDTMIDLEEYNVYDSAGVLIEAVTNSVAVSKSLLSVKAMIYDGIVG